MTNEAAIEHIEPIALNEQFAEASNSLVHENLPLAEIIAQLGFDAMVLEVSLTPKPGLVDSISKGAHKDMDMGTFLLSAQAIRPFLTQFFKAGLNNTHLSELELLSVLRPIGINAEAAMFEATNNVNTHKGMIFTLGLVCGAAGWLYGNNQAVNSTNISHTIKHACHYLVASELVALKNNEPKSYGESIFQQYGLTGARGEAASGLATVINVALPVFESYIDNNAPLRDALLQTLLVLFSHNQDTNLVSRGGIEGLKFVQEYAQNLINKGGVSHVDFITNFTDFDRLLVEKNLSPGGSADLLAITWLLDELNKMK